jgi:hypothetical protein
MAVNEKKHGNKGLLIKVLIIGCMLVSLLLPVIGSAAGTLTTLKPVVKNGGLMVGFARANYILARSLAANTAESFTVPSGAQYVNFSATADYYVSFVTTATVPGDTTDGSASVLNPGLRSIEGATTISVISAATCIITAEFFK